MACLTASASAYRTELHSHLCALHALFSFVTYLLIADSTYRPGILTAIWGSANLGRNFGILSYAPFIGTSAFSYMYAFLFDRHSTPAEPASPLREPSKGSPSTCTGPQCWQTTFSVCIASLALACCVTGALWKQWQGRV